MSVLESERLVLREFHLDDAEFILELLNEAAFCASSATRA